MEQPSPQEHAFIHSSEGTLTSPSARHALSGSWEGSARSLPVLSSSTAKPKGVQEQSLQESCAPVPLFVPCPVQLVAMRGSWRHSMKVQRFGECLGGVWA